MSSLSDTYIADTFDGLLHSGGQPLPETGLTPMYDGLGNESSFSLGRTCNGARICGQLTVGSLVIENVDTEAEYTTLLNRFFPVHTVYFTAVDLNPGYSMGGTWVRISEGMFVAGIGTGVDSNGVSVTIAGGKNSGEYRHTLSESEMPSHTHSLKASDGEQFYLFNDGNDSSPTTESRSRSDGPDDSKDGRYMGVLPSAGGSGAHNNMPPSFGLYIWKRTA